MRCVRLLLSVGLLLTITAGTVQAHWWTNFCRDYHRNKNWPQPFVQVDRADTLMPFAIMQNNGWQRQHLLADYHFTPDSQQLSEAGKLKVHWILTQAPAHRRTIYLEMSAPQTLVSRMRAVQDASTHFMPPGQLADVRASQMMTEGWPADQVDRTNVQFQDSRPVPALPASGPASTTGQ